MPLNTCSQQDARIHYATLNTQPHPNPPQPPPHPPTHNILRVSGCVRRSRPGAAQKKHPPGVFSGPNSVPNPPERFPGKFHESIVMFHPATPTPTCGRVWNQGKGEPTPTTTSQRSAGDAWRAGQPHHTVRLLRKEVIQPHLPVRLPCYDFVPIASPTFDGSIPQGVRPPASGVADFRDVTGGVYKARERIHRSVADLRLLATPTSRGRVADPDPN